MKRRVIVSSIISVIITAILCGINWLNVVITGNIWGIEILGGEYVEWRGFGVVKGKTYPEFHVDNPIESTVNYGFDIFSLMGTLIISFIIISTISIVLEKRREKK